jgi:hypothetical protein
MVSHHNKCLFFPSIKILIELGEKSRDRWALNLPVEVRLVGFILLQAGIFYLCKIISEKGGSTIYELFRAITGQPPQDAVNQITNSEQPKKKMRGPSINVGDIKKMTEVKEDDTSEPVKTKQKRKT